MITISRWKGFLVYAIGLGLGAYIYHLTRYSDAFLTRLAVSVFVVMGGILVSFLLGGRHGKEA